MALPPDASKVKPVVNEQALDTIKAKISAASSGSPTRPIGIRPSMYLRVSSLVSAFIGVLITAGARAFIVIPSAATSLPTPLIKPIIPAPKLPGRLEKRESKVFETIAIDEEEITVNLYDNAEIDGDIITVLFNGELVASQKTLSDKPITIKLKAIRGRDNTLTMYEENQVSVPPNTAIMRVQNGDQYYKVFLSADDKKNGSVVFRFKS